MESKLSLHIPSPLLDEIHSHGEKSYPEEGVGLMMGYEKDGIRYVAQLLYVDNAREESARHNRYLITAEDMLRGENEAETLGLNIVGIFHSHPDHPNIPSDFDRENAIPWYSYLITSVAKGIAIESQSWQLSEDRSHFIPEEIKGG
jgi:proteasome lid subunit RPN8/RPN11